MFYAYRLPRNRRNDVPLGQTGQPQGVLEHNEGTGGLLPLVVIPVLDGDGRPVQSLRGRRDSALVLARRLIQAVATVDMMEEQPESSLLTEEDMARAARHAANLAGQIMQGFVNPGATNHSLNEKDATQ